jgi:hypothetical protein
MRHFLGIVSLLAVLTGCATYVLDQQRLDSLNRIGAVSLLGDTLKVTFGGITIFTNKAFEADVTAWEIDNFVEKVIGDAILADGRYSYVELDVDRGAMTKISRAGYWGCRGHHNASVIRDEIENLVSKYDIDTLVFVLERSVHDSSQVFGRSEPLGLYHRGTAAQDFPLVGEFIYGLYKTSFFGWKLAAPHMLVGYGLHQGSFLGLKLAPTKLTATHAYGFLIVVDTSSLQEIGSRLLASHQLVKNRYWGSGFKGPAAADERFVKESIKGQLRTGVVEALKEMRLIR